MEAGRSLLSSSQQLPLRAHFWNSSYSSSASSLVRHSPTSVLIQDHRNESRKMVSLKEESSLKQTTDDRLVVMGPASSSNEKNKNVDPNRYLDEFQLELSRPEVWYLWLSLHGKAQSFPTSKESLSYKGENFMRVAADHVVALAREALSACREAASISKDAELSGAHLDDSLSLFGAHLNDSFSLFGAHLDDSFSPRRLANVPVQNIMRSKRHLEMQAKKRRVLKAKFEVQQTDHHEEAEPRRKFDKGFDQNDPLRMFLKRPESRKLLTRKEESELIAKTQELIKLNELRSRLKTQFSREPTLFEWATAAGISCQALQSQIRSSDSSRDKLIYANFRLVVHIAKHYQGRGLDLQDLLQAGVMGLMRSVEKFKPEANCKFASYAYWWIRQSIRKMIFQHSRTIRLPDHVYALLSKVHKAEQTCYEQGNHHPTIEDIAACAGMTVKRVQMLLYHARKPVSLQQTVWRDQNTKYEEIIADPTIELPDIGVAKQLMRQHVRYLLSGLNPKERKVIRLRFGFEDGQKKSLSEIGDGLGFTKERARQVEREAMRKLKECIDSQGLEAYKDLLV